MEFIGQTKGIPSSDPISFATGILLFAASSIPVAGRHLDVCFERDQGGGREAVLQPLLIVWRAFRQQKTHFKGPGRDKATIDHERFASELTIKKTCALNAVILLHY